MTVDGSVDTAIINESLQKVAKGAGLVFIGMVIGMIFGFVNRILIARYFTKADYGIFSLSFVIVNVCITVSLLGLQQGLTRQIAYHHNKNDSRINKIVSTAVQIILISSISLSIILIFSSDFLSVKIFHDFSLKMPLKIFAVSIPFFALIMIFVSIFRGFGNVKEKVFFQDLARNVFFLSFLFFVIALNLPFVYVIYAFTASVAITFVIFIFYIYKKGLLSKIKLKDFDMQEGKKLLFFSLPLLGVFMLNMIMNWTDTLMLGYYKSSDIVGLYNAASPLARLLSIFLTSLGFIYMPIISLLYSQNLIGEIKKVYQIITKWVFSFTLPFSMIFLLFPKAILTFFFGSKYVEAVPVLQFLSICFLFHSFLGPQGETLLAMGKSKYLSYAAVTGAVLNVALNASLIPMMGLAGAAIATMISWDLAQIINLLGLYHYSKIQPFTVQYLKPVMGAVIATSIIYLITKWISIKFWALPLLFVLYIFIYGLSLLFTKSVEKEDIEMVLMIENRLGIENHFISKIVRRFV